MRVLAVILFFFVLYAAMSYYVYRDVAVLLKTHTAWRWVLAAAMTVMVLAVPGVRLLARWGLPHTGGAVGTVLFTYMVMVCWFTLVSLLLRTWNGGLLWAAQAAPSSSTWMIPSGWRQGATLAVVLAAAVWAFVEAQTIPLKHVSLVCPRLPAGSEPLRIVQITDVHLGGGAGARRLKHIVELTRSARPDVILFTGDLTDVSVTAQEETLALLSSLQPPLGKWGVPGNHEYYLGIDLAKEFYEAAGIRMLRNEIAQVNPVLRLVACDDPAGTRLTDHEENPGEPDLSAMSDGMAVVLLRHRPHVRASQRGKFDLQLSGHTHGGQIFPFTIVLWLMEQYKNGFFDVGDGSRLYVSRGAGTWGPPMRLLAPPEVTVIEIASPPASKD